MTWRDDEVSPPAATCDGTTGPIMCAIIQDGPLSQFSDRSKTDIADYVDSNSFCLDAVAPARPVSISIASERCYSLHTVFWRPTAGATRYELQRSTSSSFTNPTQVYSGSRDSWTGGGAGYYYRVRSCNALGCSDFEPSSTRSTYHSGCS